MIAALLAIGVGTGVIDVSRFGAKRDGKTDDTPAFQQAIDSAKPGDTILAGPGNYLFKGDLNVTEGVCLQGSWKSVPAHNGIRDKGLPLPTGGGTTFLIASHAGHEDAKAFLTLNTNSTLKGVVLYYPDQNPATEPTPYPYAIAMRGKNPSVQDVEMLNPFDGIDASNNERHLIRNVQGQPLHIGIFVDQIYDIGRIENVHFNPWWSIQPKLLRWQQEHGQAFVFARTDWQYVLNTFCFGYNIGYRFIKSKDGNCNGNFLGIGADDCYTAIQVDDCAPYGLLITNGEFTAFHGPDPTMVRVGSGNTGSIRMSNCAFWGPCNQIAKIDGRGTVGFGDCTFVQWNGKNAAIQATGGKLLVRGCEFRQDGKHISVGSQVKSVIGENIAPGEVNITHEGG